MRARKRCPNPPHHQSDCRLRRRNNRTEGCARISSWLSWRGRRHPLLNIRRFCSAVSAPRRQAGVPPPFSSHGMRDFPRLPGDELTIDAIRPRWPQPAATVRPPTPLKVHRHPFQAYGTGAHMFDAATLTRQRQRHRAREPGRRATATTWRRRTTVWQAITSRDAGVRGRTARAPEGLQDNDGMSGEHHGRRDGHTSRIDHRLRPHGREQPSPPSFCC